MSNENNDWKRETVVEHYTPLGWKITVDPNDPSQKEFLVKDDLRLSVVEAYEIYFSFRNVGYDTALEHIKGKINEELYDL